MFLKSLTPVLTNLPSSAYRWQRKLTNWKKKSQQKTSKTTHRHRWGLLVGIGWAGEGGHFLVVVVYFAYRNAELTLAGKLFWVHVMTLSRRTFISWRSNDFQGPCISKKLSSRTSFNPYCSFTLLLSQLIFSKVLQK